MSEAVTLTLRAAPERTVEADGIAPDRLAGLSEREIADLPVWHEGRAVALGELFAVRGERSARVRVEGDLGQVDAVGAGMAGGELVIVGNAGRYVGTRMMGGTITVRGHVGDGAGVEMAGGLIDIEGDAGDRVGAARLGAARGMTGGEIIVRGAAGREAGASMRRGLVVVGGDAGERAGHRMIAGSVIVLGSAGRGAGQWTKRGTVVAMGDLEVPATFRYACTYQPPHVRLALTYLRTRRGVPVQERDILGRYRRYSGDLAELGKGEILQWTPD